MLGFEKALRDFNLKNHLAICEICNKHGVDLGVGSEMLRQDARLLAEHITPNIAYYDGIIAIDSLVADYKELEAHRSK